MCFSSVPFFLVVPVSCSMKCQVSASRLLSPQGENSLIPTYTYTIKRNLVKVLASTIRNSRKVRMNGPKNHSRGTNGHYHHPLYYTEACIGECVNECTRCWYKLCLAGLAHNAAPSVIGQSVLQNTCIECSPSASLFALLWGSTEFGRFHDKTCTLFFFYLILDL